MQKTFIKIYGILSLLFFFILGCNKNQGDTKNLKTNTSVTPFQFFLNRQEKNSQKIQNWEVNTKLKCLDINYIIEMKFTNKDDKTIFLPSNNDNCTLTVMSFKLDNILYTPNEKNNPYIFYLLPKEDPLNKNIGHYVSKVHVHRFLSGKINANKFLLSIFKTEESSLLYNDIYFTFIPMDEEYSRLEIKNNSLKNITINKINSTQLKDKKITIWDHSKKKKDNKYKSHPQCTDKNMNSQYQLNEVHALGICSLVFKTINSQFGIHTTTLDIEINHIKYFLDITNKLYLYLAGSFTTPCLFVAQWDGKEYKCLINNKLEKESKVDPSGYALFQVPNGNLYLGKSYDKKDPLGGIMKWDGNTWSTVYSPLDHLSGKISSLAVDPEESLIFAGNQFKLSSDIPNDLEYNHLRLFQNTNERSIALVDKMISTLSFSPDFLKLYVGGYFTYIQDILNNVAIKNSIASIVNIEQFKKNPSTNPSWAPVGSGSFSGDIQSILPFNDQVYVTGSFFYHEKQDSFESIKNFVILDLTNQKWKEQKNSAFMGTEKRIISIKKSLADDSFYVGGQQFINNAKDYKNVFARWHNKQWIFPSEVFPIHSSTNAIAVSPDGKTVFIAGEYVGVETPGGCDYIMGYEVNEKEMQRFCLSSSNRTSLDGAVNALELKNNWSIFIY